MGAGPLAEWCASGWGRCIWAMPIACISASVTANACLLSPPQRSRLRLADVGPFLCSEIMRGEANQVADCRHVHTKFRCLFWPANRLGDPGHHDTPQSACQTCTGDHKLCLCAGAGAGTAAELSTTRPAAAACGGANRPSPSSSCVGAGTARSSSTAASPAHSMCPFCAGFACPVRAGRARNPALTHALLTRNRYGAAPQHSTGIRLHGTHRRIYFSHPHGRAAGKRADVSGALKTPSSPDPRHACA